MQEKLDDTMLLSLTSPGEVIDFHLEITKCTISLKVVKILPSM